MKVILLGYMGSGKSTIGHSLSKINELPFIDLDEYIESKEGLSIPQIFSTKGEIYFRKQESFYLKGLLNSSDSFVLSLGGGTPCYANNMESITSFKDVHSFYLQLNISNLVTRLKEAKQQRPLISELSDNQLTEYIAKHLFERRDFYQQANTTIKCDGKSLEEVVTEIRMVLY